MTTNLDSQQVEILGRAALTVSLVADKLEVATPERDAGIDLIAFTVKPWRVMPIQLKAANAELTILAKLSCALARARAVSLAA
jgi:hypothetical protein